MFMFHTFSFTEDFTILIDSREICIAKGHDSSSANNPRCDFRQHAALTFRAFAEIDFRLHKQEKIRIDGSRRIQSSSREDCFVLGASN